MTRQQVDFRKTTAAVLKDFRPEFTDLIVNVLESRNTAMITHDGKENETFANIRSGYGLLIMADYVDNKKNFTKTTEFLVPSKKLAASFMVMWRRWCDKHDVGTREGLLSLMHRIAKNMNDIITEGNEHARHNLAIGLMGAVLDNYPETIASMCWSVDNGHVPCLVIANDDNQAKCGVCYGGVYMTPEQESQI